MFMRWAVWALRRHRNFLYREEAPGKVKMITTVPKRGASGKFLSDARKMRPAARTHFFLNSWDDKKQPKNLRRIRGWKERRRHDSFLYGIRSLRGSGR